MEQHRHSSQLPTNIPMMTWTDITDFTKQISILATDQQLQWVLLSMRKEANPFKVTANRTQGSPLWVLWTRCYFNTHSTNKETMAQSSLSKFILSARKINVEPWKKKLNHFNGIGKEKVIKNKWIAMRIRLLVTKIILSLISSKCF